MWIQGNSLCSDVGRRRGGLCWIASAHVPLSTGDRNSINLLGLIVIQGGISGKKESPRPKKKSSPTGRRFFLAFVSNHLITPEDIRSRELCVPYFFLQSSTVTSYGEIKDQKQASKPNARTQGSNSEFEMQWCDSAMGTRNHPHSAYNGNHSANGLAACGYRRVYMCNWMKLNTQDQLLLPRTCSDILHPQIPRIICCHVDAHRALDCQELYALFDLAVNSVRNRSPRLHHAWLS